MYSYSRHPQRGDDSKLGAPYFYQQKSKTNQVIFLSDFINLNRQLKHNPCTVPKIIIIILKL